MKKYPSPDGLMIKNVEMPGRTINIWHLIRSQRRIVEERGVLFGTRRVDTECSVILPT